MALTLPEAEGWNAGLVPPYSSWGSGWECPLRQPWAPGGGSTRLWVWACEWPHYLPPEPPYWGADETSGLLERVAGENASLPCPARGEAGPWAGWEGEKTHPCFSALGRCGQCAWVWRLMGSPLLPRTMPGTSSHQQPYRMGISISSFFFCFN